MDVSKVPASVVTSRRLDADYYKNEYLDIEQRLQSLKTCGFGCVGKFFAGPFGSKLPSNLYGDQGIPLFRVGNIGIFEILNEGMAYISDDVHEDICASEVIPGDLLIVKASVGEKIAKVPESILKANITQHIIGIRPNGRFDADYVTVFIYSKYGKKQLERNSLGSIIQYLGVHDARSVSICEFDSRIQKYIGDKVRQAERLRAWGKKLEWKMDQFIVHYQPIRLEASRLFSKVQPSFLTTTLTATTYKDHYILNQRNLRNQGEMISLPKMFQSVTNGFDERDEKEDGIKYIKVADVKKSYIDIENAPSIRQSALLDASDKQIPDQGDLLLTRKGSFGIAAVVMTSKDFLCSSEVFSCKPVDYEKMPILSWFLNSDAGNLQFWQFATGTTMPGINQENLANIIVPNFSEIDLSLFNELHALRYQGKRTVEKLTSAAKLLVEALIEGLITESDLIDAQQALESGDNTLDRAILSRITDQGFDGDGEPLFADLDQLYSLLAQAEQEEELSEEMD